MPTGLFVPRYSEEQKEQAFHLYRQGHTLENIAEKLGVSVGAVRTWSSKRKWRARVTEMVASRTLKRSGSASTSVLPPPDESATRKLHIAKTLALNGRQAAFNESMALLALRIGFEMEQTPVAVLLSMADKWEKLEKIARRGLGLEDAAPPAVVNVGILASPGLPSAITVSSHTLSPSESVRVGNPLPLEEGADAPDVERILQEAGYDVAVLAEGDNPEGPSEEG